MVGVSLDNTIGAAYLGVVGSAILFGVTNLQTYLYFTHYPNDRPLQKLVVALLWFLDAFHLSLTVQVVYHYLISSFGDFAAQVYIIWSLKLQTAVNIVIILFVQTLYTIRVWRLGRHFHRLLPWFAVLVLVVGYGVGISLGVQTYRMDTFKELTTMAWTIYLSFATSTFNDFVIAIIMCFYLQPSRSGFSELNSTLVTLMRYVLASGLATSACSMVCLIAYALMPNTLVFLGIEFLLTKLYINSFLAMLNARRTVNHQETEVGMSTSNLPSHPTPFAVHVSTTRTHVSDRGDVSHVELKGDAIIPRASLAQVTSESKSNPESGERKDGRRGGVNTVISTTTMSDGHGVRSHHLSFDGAGIGIAIGGEDEDDSINKDEWVDEDSPSRVYPEEEKLSTSEDVIPLSPVTSSRKGQ